MVEQYPYKLYVGSETEATQDANGNWVAGSSENVLAGPCREEPNGSGQLINLPDGKAYKYASMIYMPHISVPIKHGQSIEILDGNLVIHKGTVIRVHVGQLNTRIWL